MPSQTFDISALVRERSYLIALQKRIPTIITRAAGTLKRRLPVVARRDIQTEYALPAARITAGLRVGGGQGFVTITGSARGIGLINFGGRWRRKLAGASVVVLKGSGRKTLTHTFIATGRGNQQIFERVGTKRLPIQVKYGPSIAMMLRKETRVLRLKVLAQEIILAEIARLGKVKNG